jgi:hypothetical protein
MMSVLVYLGIESLGFSLTHVKFVQMFIFCLIFQIPASIVRNIKPLHVLSLIGIGILLYIISVTII